MFERFTKDARQVVLGAVRKAADCGEDKAGPDYLLLSLVELNEGVGARVLADYGVTAAELQAAITGPTRRAGLTEEEITALRSVGIDADEVFRRLEEAFGPTPFDEPPTRQPRRRGLLGGPFNSQAKKALELSLREAIALHHRYIGTEHFLLALLRQGVPGPTATVLTEHGVTYDDAKQRILTALSNAT